MAKVYAAYYTDDYKPAMVTTSVKEFKSFIGHMTYDMRIYNNLTKDQVSVLSLAQAQFFEMIMEENNNAKLGL